MQIALVRHGRPNAGPRERTPIAGTDLGRWYSRYNDLGIVEGAAPSPAARALAASAGCIVASDLRRAVESAALLAGDRLFSTDAGLREVGFPESMKVALALSPMAWVWLARVAWLANQCDTDETVADTRTRATSAVDRLCTLASEHRSVLAVGHGWFNQFLARELRRRGWTGPRLFRGHYWATATYLKDL